MTSYAPPRQNVARNKYQGVHRANATNAVGNLPAQPDFQEIFSAMATATVVAGVSRDLIYANAAARRMFPQFDANPLFAVPDFSGMWRDDTGAEVPPELFPLSLTATSQKGHEAVLRFGPIDGESLWFQISTAPVIDPATTEMIAVVGQFVNVSAYKAQEARLTDLVNVDVLTRLPNRRAVFENMERGLMQASRNKKQFAVCYLDLDGFKPVNDSFGHDAGDRLLVETSKRIRHELRSGDTAGRLGGDEFCLLLADINEAKDVIPVLQRVLASIEMPFVVDDTQTAAISASIGVAMYPSDGHDAHALMRCADSTMYLAKRRGKNRIEFYDRLVDKQVEDLRLLLQEVMNGIENNEFRLWFQPKVNLESGQVAGLEALVRWQHPTRGLLYPPDFLHAIECTDLIIHLGEWIIAEAMKCAMDWRAKGLELPVSVNVAARQLAHPEFFSKLAAVVRRYPDRPDGLLQLELLETNNLNEADSLRTMLDRCRQLGISIAIDDFGTGSSSLTSFRRLPADTLKMDRNCVSGIFENDDDFLMVRGIIAMADAFGIDVVASGTATPEHGARLFAAGCHLVQGYGIAHPMPAGDVFAWCKQFTPDPRWTDTTPYKHHQVRFQH